MTTTRMSLDLSVYSELYLPGNYRDQVNAVSRGYGEYDIVIPQTYTWTGKFTSVSGDWCAANLLCMITIF